MTIDVTKTHVLHEWKHGRPMVTCRYEPRGRYLVSSSEDYSLQRWDVATGDKVAWAAHDSWVLDLAFLPDGQTLISAGCDDRLMFWSVDREQPEALREVVAHQGWVRSVDVSPDGSLVASGGNDRTVRIWTPDGQLVHELAGHERDVYSVYFHPDGRFLLSGDLDGKVHQWDVRSGDRIRTFEAADLHSYNSGQQVHYGGIRDISISPDGTILALTGLHKATNPLGAVNEPLNVLFDWKTGEQVRKQPAEGVRGIGWNIGFLADGTEVVASGGSGGGFLLFFRLSDEKPSHQVKMKNTARAMSVHPDGQHVATAHHDGFIRVSKMTAKAE